MDPVPVKPVRNLAPAAWLAEQLTGFDGRVRDVVPTRFEAIARVLHRYDQGLDTSGRWADVAAYCGTTLHPLAQFQMLAGLDQESTATRPWDEQDAPLDGSMDVRTLEALRDHLRPHTTTPATCWFGLWDGYGGQPPAWAGHPLLELPHRSYRVFAGSIDEVVEISIEFECLGMEHDSPSRGWVIFGGGGGTPSLTPADRKGLADRWRAMRALQSPNLMWPADRAWAVASEIDFDSTLVAGPAALIEELVAADDLEAFAVDPDDSLRHDGDRINTR